MDRSIENILDTGGRNLSPADRQFVSTLVSELEQFQYQAPKDRALMFHPLGGYQRYLIHKVTEIFPKLTSFSIGDDSNRRTVVCFKSKRKEQQLQQMGPNSPEKQPPRGRSNDYATAPARSRDSSRGRNRQGDMTPDRPASKKGKHPDHAGHMPKPLRSKKAAKQANSLPRSRSLHASPARQADRESYYTDDDRQRKMKPERGDGPPSRRKDMLRSASLKDTRKSRSRPTSPPDAMARPKSGTMPSRPSENSLRKRGQGLRLEGMVVNGDVEDPYNPDSDTNQARSDAEAIKREKSRKRQDAKKKHHKSRRAKSEPESSDQDRPRSNRRRHTHIEAPVTRPRSESEESESDKPRRRSASASSQKRKGKTVDRKQKDPAGKRKPEKPIDLERRTDMSDDDYPSDEPSSSRAPNTRSVNDEIESSSELDAPRGRGRMHSRDLENDELPPSYDKTSELSSPASKAKRNLNRIRRADSVRSRSPATTERSPSNSSARSDATSRHEEEPREPKRKTTSTFPRHSKRHSDDEEIVPDDIPTRTSPSKHRKDADPDMMKRRRSAGSLKYNKKSGKKTKNQPLSNSHPHIAVQNEDLQKNAPSPVFPRKNHREEQADVHRSPAFSRRSDDNLLASDATLYKSLPSNARPQAENHYVEPAPEYAPLEHDYVNRPQNLMKMPPQPTLSSNQAPPSSHSTLSSPVTEGSQGFTPRKDVTAERCDGEAQTELTGTLTRKAASKRAAPVTNKASAQPVAPAAPSPPVVEAAKLESPSYHTADSSIPSNSTTPSAPANEKLMEEFCKVMLNFQKMFISSQTSTPPTDTSFSSHLPNMEPFHPFAPFYGQRKPHDTHPTTPMAPMTLYNQFPPPIAHQLYLSWMAAYYAGATGSWPPPPPPVPSQMSAPKEASRTPQYEYPSYMAMPGVPPFPGYMDERGKGDYQDPSESQSGPFDSSDYYQRHHPTYFKQPDHKMDQPSSLVHDEFQPAPEPFASVSEPGSHGRRSSNSDWGSGSKTRGRPTHKWPFSDHASKPSDPATRSHSTVLTDGVDTDVSSVTSSSTHPEVAMKEGKGGVMVYVRSSSRSNSRANSTVSGGEDAISLHSSSSHGLTLAPPTKTHVNSRSRDGDDEDTPDQEVLPVHKKKGKPVNSGAEESPGRKHSKKGQDKRSTTPVGGSVNGDLTGPPSDRRTEENKKRASPKMTGEGVTACSEISIHTNDIEHVHAETRGDSSGHPYNNTFSGNETVLCQSLKHDLSLESYSNNFSGDESFARCKNSYPDSRYPAIVLVSSPTIDPPPEFGSGIDVESVHKEELASILEHPTLQKGHKFSSDLEGDPRSAENPEINIANEEVILSLSRAPLATMDEDEEMGFSEDNLSASTRSNRSEIKSVNSEENGGKSDVASKIEMVPVFDETEFNGVSGGVENPVIDEEPENLTTNLPTKIPETELPIVVSEFDSSDEDDTSERNLKTSSDLKLVEESSSSSSESSDEDATHVYDTRTSERSDENTDYTEEEAKDSNEVVPTSSSKEKEQEYNFPPPPTSTDLQSILGDVLPSNVSLPRKPSSNFSTENATSGSNRDSRSGSEFELVEGNEKTDSIVADEDVEKFPQDHDEAGATSGELPNQIEENFQEFRDVYDKPLTLDSSDAVHGKSKDELPPVVNDSEGSSDESDHDDLAPTPESREPNSTGSPKSRDTPKLDPTSNTLAGSPTGVDWGSIPLIDDGSESTGEDGNSDVESHHSSPSKKNNGYDADRSTNLGSEEDSELGGAQPVNGLTNGPNSALPSDLERQIDGDITVQEPQYDYYNWKPNEELYSSPPYNTILEIHDFPPGFKDNDILKHFKKTKGFKLVWVDDTHALGMFSSAEDVEAALKLNVRMMRLRPLVHASTQSRKKAKIRVEEFGDYSSAHTKPRPETSNVVARKMVLGALGIKESQKDKEKRAELENTRQSKKQRAKENK